MVMNLQQRVRQLETALAGDDAAACRAWSLEELLLLLHVFECSQHSVTRTCHPAPAPHDHDGTSHSESHADGSSNRDVIISSDYFITWLTTDKDEGRFGVKYRAHAVKCGAALMQHKVPICSVWNDWLAARRRCDAT